MRARLTLPGAFDNKPKRKAFSRVGGRPPEASVLLPSQDVFEELAQRGNLVPVVREVLADLDTPLSLFRRLDDGATSFLFESVEGGERWARFSFIGLGSRAIFRARGRDAEWSERGHTERIRVDGDPLEVLREKLAGLHAVMPEGVDLPPFVGGAVGMVAYDWVRFVERLPDANPDEAGLPDLWFSLPETVVAYDNAPAGGAHRAPGARGSGRRRRSPLPRGLCAQLDAVVAPHPRAAAAGARPARRCASRWT